MSTPVEAKKNKNIPIKKFFPYILIVILLMVLAIFVFTIINKKNPADKLIVNMSLPIEKSGEETNKIIVPYAGNTTKEKIQVKFTWKAGDMSYRDALYFTPEEYAKLTPEIIEKMKLERMKNWADTVNTASRQK